MGKASKFKKLRKAAKQLPVINLKIAVPGDTVKGSNLIKQGLTKCKDGKDVQPELYYREGKVIERPLNHNRIMKQQYNKGGYAAVGAYANAVIQHVKKSEQQKENAKTDELSKV